MINPAINAPTTAARQVRFHLGQSRLLLRRTPRRAFVLRLGVAWAMALGGAAQAQFIASDDLFLAPAAVPLAVYDPFDAVAGQDVLFSGDLVALGSSLVGVHILPILNPNPARGLGYYQPKELAAINVSNYSSFYSMQPNQDYFATAIQGNASTVKFNNNGTYFVELVTSNGAALSSKIIYVSVDSDFLPPPDGTGQAVAAQTPYPVPRGSKAGLVLISTQNVPGNTALLDAGAVYPNRIPVGSITDPNDGIIKRVKDEYDRVNRDPKTGKPLKTPKKITLTLVGHGENGSIQIGNGTLIQDFTGTRPPGTVTPEEFQMSIDPWVDHINFIACSLGGGSKGQAFLTAIKKSMLGTNAPTLPLTVVKGPTPGQSYFTIVATGTKNSLGTVPEPQTWLMLAAGFGLVGGALRRKAMAPSS